MKPELILRSDLLDILFEHRNKDYGAYKLRRLYNNHLLAGIGGMVLFAAALWLLAPKYNGKGVAASLFPLVVSDTFNLSPAPDLTPPPTLPPPPQARRQQVATLENPVPVIDPNATQTEVPEQTVIDQNRIGTETKEGLQDDGMQNGPDNRVTLSGPPAPVPPPVEEALEVLTSAAVMPQFPGGEAALQRWLSRQLKPQEAQEPGQRIKVVARFVVGRSGEIDRIELVQPGGAAFDQEVLRVIHKMPRWEPGQHNGKTVAVWFTIPIIFEMSEQ